MPMKRKMMNRERKLFDEKNVNEYMRQATFTGNLWIGNGSKKAA